MVASPDWDDMTDAEKRAFELGAESERRRAMSVRAKFRLDERAEVTWNKTGRRFKFTAVCDDGTPENQKFAKYTPSGTFEMFVDNPAVIEQLVLGKQYYLDLTPAD